MNVVISIDSFKGSLTTNEAANAAANGIKRVYKNASIQITPIADGGEGTSQTLTAFKGGKIQNVTVLNPVGKKITAEYGISDSTGIIEMASAAGIALIDETDRNPLHTTTYGVGMMISDAIKKGCRNFIIGIGGSATNDCGVGMLQALGFEFLDTSGNQVPYGAKGLKLIHQIKTDKVNPYLKDCRFTIACDVKNPLCGENGCSNIYGPQKGATPEMITMMDEWMKNFADLTNKFNPKSSAETEGAGAAGGMGFAFLSYLNATLEPGIEMMIRETNLEEHIKKADIVITGEGRLDGQTSMGKVPTGIANVAKKYNKPVIALSGCITDDAKSCNNFGIDAFFPIIKAPCSLSDAMNKDNAVKNLSDTTEQIFRLIKTFKL